MLRSHRAYSYEIISMLKKFPWKTVLLTLLAWTLFWEVKETLTGERQIFLVRWLYSDKGHAKKIEVLAYLLTNEQVSFMFAHPNEIVQQLSQKELSSKNVNVVLRMRNVTDGAAWGRLLWTMEGKGWNAVDVNFIPTPRQSEKYADIIIPLGKIPFGRTDSPPESISIKWDDLYVYR